MNDAAAEPSVIAEVAHGVGRLVLNKPRMLNALDPEMIAALATALETWRDDAAVRIVTIEGAGGRAFCAGGNVRLIRDNVLRGDAAASEAFFSSEYRVNRMIAEYPKPYVALIDGLSMGGGMGLSIHGAYRVVTEHAVMAMPESRLACESHEAPPKVAARTRAETTWRPLAARALDKRSRDGARAADSAGSSRATAP